MPRGQRFLSHFTAAPVLTLSFYVNLRLKRIFGLAIFSPCSSFSHGKQWLPSVFIPCVRDGCALSLKSNPTWLSFSSDDIRVYLKGLGLVVCTSDFLAKPANPWDGVRRITVSASLAGGWQSACEVWTLFKCLCLAVFNEGMWSRVLSLNNLKSPRESPLSAAHVMSWLRVYTCHESPASTVSGWGSGHRQGV